MATTPHGTPARTKKATARKPAGKMKAGQPDLSGTPDSSPASGPVVRSDGVASGHGPMTTAGGMPVGPVVVPPILVVSGTAATEGTDVSVLKKQQLVARVVAATGAKKKDARDVVEATLAIIGDALSAGEELTLPPLGKIKINRAKADGPAEILILRLRRGGGDPAAKEGLADEDEDD